MTSRTSPGFDIDQDATDGSISVANLPFSISGRSYRLYRPLNSRQPWPLWITDDADRNFEPLGVFDECGNLSLDFEALVRAR